MTIVITGSIAFDYLMKFPGYFKDHLVPEHLDKISVSFLVDTMVRQRGGVAPNIAYTLALLGDTPVIFGTAGEDIDEYKAWLAQKGINTKYIRKIPGVFTASFFANTDLSNNQICSFYTGAMAYAREFPLRDYQEEPPALVVISPNDPQAMDQYVSECQELGIPYLYDPSQQVARASGEELRRGVEGAYSLFVNEYEWELLQKHTGLSASNMINMVKLVVITEGSEGAVVFEQGKETQVPVAPEKAIVDPTGVGDAFRGGFLRGWELGLGSLISGQMGSLAAAYCLEQRGTQSHFYTPETFVERFRQNFDDQGALNVLLNK